MSVIYYIGTWGKIRLHGDNVVLKHGNCSQITQGYVVLERKNSGQITWGLCCSWTWELRSHLIRLCDSWGVAKWGPKSSEALLPQGLYTTSKQLPFFLNKKNSCDTHLVPIKYPLGFMGKQKVQHAFQKLECPPPWWVLHFSTFCFS